MGVFLWAQLVWALPPEYEILIEKNPFSPERQYVPADSDGKAGSGGQMPGQDLKKELILRGTFDSGARRWAVIEVSSSFKIRHHLKKSRFVLEEGQKIGPCEILEIRRGEVVLGGGCRRVTLCLADAPERKKPLPQPRPAPKKALAEDQKASQKKPRAGASPGSKKPMPKMPSPFERIFKKKNLKAP